MSAHQLSVSQILISHRFFKEKGVGWRKETRQTRKCTTVSVAENYPKTVDAGSLMLICMAPSWSDSRFDPMGEKRFSSPHDHDTNMLLFSQMTCLLCSESGYPNSPHSAASV